MKWLTATGLVLSLVTACSGVSSSPQYINMIDSNKEDLNELSACIITQLDVMAADIQDIWSRMLGREPVKHYIEQVSDGVYEIRYRGTFDPVHDPWWYVKVTQVDNIILVEQYPPFTGFLPAKMNRLLQVCFEGSKV